MIGKRYSYVYLVIGFVFLFFYNGRWILPISAFIAPIFLMRFLRFHKPIYGFLVLLFVFWIANIFIWKNMLPASGFFYYFLMFMFAVPTSIIFLFDKIFTKKIKGIISTLVFPSAFVIVEYITINLNPSGSYGSLAHTQLYLPLLQIVSVTGIWGLIFIVTWIPSIINWLWDNSFEVKKLKLAFFICIVPLLFIILFGQVRLSIDNNSETVMIASVIVDKDKIDSIPSRDFLNDCKNAANAGAKIIFANEGAISLYDFEETEFIDDAKNTAINYSVYLGLPIEVLSENSLNKVKIVWISPTGEILFTYYKSKPTTGEVVSGDGIIKYFDSPYGRIGTAICFDMDFPSLINQVSEMDIDIMLIPGNDWQDIAPYHTYVASMRSIEHGFNMVRAASNGLSATFNYKGEVLATLDDFVTEDTIMFSNTPTNGQRTIYSVLGDYFAYICIFNLLILSTIYYNFGKKKSKTEL